LCGYKPSQAKIDTLYLKVDGRVTMQIVESPEVSSIVLKEQSFNTTNKTFSNEEVLTLLSGGVVQKYLENKMVSLSPPQFTEVWEEIHTEDGETVSVVTLIEQAQLSWVFLIFGMVFPFLTILFLNIFAKREKRKEILIVLVLLIVVAGPFIVALDVAAFIGDDFEIHYIGFIVACCLVSYGARQKNSLQFEL